jgi:hypothetical protein
MSICLRKLPRLVILDRADVLIRMIVEQLWEMRRYGASQSLVAALRSRAVILVLNRRRSAVIAQERKRKSSRTDRRHHGDNIVTGTDNTRENCSGVQPGRQNDIGEFALSY